MTTAQQLPQVDILVQAGKWPPLEEVQKIVLRAISATVTIAELRYQDEAELSVVMSDDCHVRELNRQWRNIDKATNVLSFPAQEVSPAGIAGMLLGDIVLANETVNREAQEQGKKFEDHLSHLVIHGFLHIFGYDHINDQEAEIMEDLERRTLLRLGIANPYEGPL